MKIDFSDDAGETFQTVLARLAGMNVRVHPMKTPSFPFDAELMGADHEDDFYDAVRVLRLDENDEVPDGTASESVRVESIYVY